MEIVILIDSMSKSGGAQRVVSIMANYWAEKDYEVSIVILDEKDSDSFYKLSPKVAYVGLGLLKISMSIFEGIYNNYHRVKIVRSYIKLHEPCTVISFIVNTNLLAIVATLGLNTRVLVSERNEPRQSAQNKLRVFLRRILYPRADYVVCQTEDMENYFKSFLINTVVIPNPVIKPSNLHKKPEIDIPNRNVLFAIGSMSAAKIYQKGLDILIPVFASLSKNNNEWILIIIGDGLGRHTLMDLVKNLDMKGKIFLPGIINNIFPVLAKGDLFVLTSRYEGFPNGLCEAMACGLPAVSFDCPTGPSEIIRNSVDGFLVKAMDVVGLEKSLDLLMNNDALRKQMGDKAKEVVDRFNLDLVMGMWENLIIKSNADNHS